jgi:hypothetical protein
MSVATKITESLREFGEEFKRKFETATRNGEETGPETLFIKIDNRFKFRKGNGESHAVVFGRDNDHRDFGGAYLHDWNIVTVDEKLSSEQLDEIFEEVSFKLKPPHAIWHGWFTGRPAWVTPTR